MIINKKVEGHESHARMSFTSGNNALACDVCHMYNSYVSRINAINLHRY